MMTETIIKTKDLKEVVTTIRDIKEDTIEVNRIKGIITITNTIRINNNSSNSKLTITLVIKTEAITTHLVFKTLNNNNHIITDKVVTIKIEITTITITTTIIDITINNSSRIINKTSIAVIKAATSNTSSNMETIIIIEAIINNRIIKEINNIPNIHQFLYSLNLISSNIINLIN